MKTVEVLKKEYLTSKEAAEFLGIKLSYLYRLTHEKRVPYYSPFGRGILFKVVELKELIERGRVASSEEVRQTAIETLTL